MRRRVRAVLALSVLLLVPATSAFAAAHAPDATPTCAFGVGDTITRGGIGAVVPAPGNGVSGDADGPNSASSLSIQVDGDGVVTIEATTNGVESPPEVCRLPRSSKTYVVLLISLFLAAVGLGAALVLVRAQRRGGALVSPEGNR